MEVGVFDPCRSVLLRHLSSDRAGQLAAQNRVQFEILTTYFRCSCGSFQNLEAFNRDLFALLFKAVMTVLGHSSERSQVRYEVLRRVVRKSIREKLVMRMFVLPLGISSHGIRSLR